MIAAKGEWFAVENVAEIPSPGLLIHSERVRENISRMIRMAGGTARLRPHIKTHKLAEVVRMQQEAGIRKFKCATIAEAELLGRCQAEDVLLAYQPVGPNVPRLRQLIAEYPRTRFSALVDHLQALREIASGGGPVDLFLDLDCGMGRTGIPPGSEAADLYQELSRTVGVRVRGLHVYDGHIHQPDPADRRKAFDAAFTPVRQFRQSLLQAGLQVPMLVAGGTPTFPYCAEETEWECSPGTCLFWDAGYGRKLPDLDFLPAAVLLTRVVSKPAGNRLCLDLGHKAVAAENPHPRVEFLNLPEAKPLMHSEEHLVVESPQATTLEVGAPIYGLPWHVCPTVALHAEVWEVRNRRAEHKWRVEARARSLGI